MSMVCVAAAKKRVGRAPAVMGRLCLPVQSMRADRRWWSALVSVARFEARNGVGGRGRRGLVV
jgi:hypothetical protein